MCIYIYYIYVYIYIHVCVRVRDRAALAPGHEIHPAPTRTGCVDGRPADMMCCSIVVCELTKC